MEFESRFSIQEACEDYLIQLRWPEGFVCPVCAGRTGRLLFHCAACGRRISVTAGTIFPGTRKPLAMWFRAMWWVTSQKDGASAKGLQQSLGLGSYQTAWTWLHKLRRAMVRPGRDQLSGLVEVDETSVGGPEENLGRGDEDPGHHRGGEARSSVRSHADGRDRGGLERRPVWVCAALYGPRQHRAHGWLGGLSIPERQRRRA